MNPSNSYRAKVNQNIQVYVRLRPTNDRERLIRSQEVIEVVSPREVCVRQCLESRMSKKFTFDRAFGPDSKQQDVYNTVVSPMIEEVLAGYNCTVFAYGQTGTGKTHTMVGEEIPTMVSSYEDNSDLGMIPRALSHLFQELRLMQVEFSMRVSYLELYNEELCDLLSSNESTQQIRIYDDSTKKGSIIVSGLEEIPVHSTSDVYKLLAKGQEKRRMATTLMNSQSSRSHTIFSILVHIRENGIEGDELLKIGKLNLVDLAGSENISKAGNERGIRTRETVNINQSLLTLGRVITALVERTPHIPYRESKLTRLLQESLGGRTKTSIIATISPGHKDLEETLSTLEYAHRAKNIQNKPEVNAKLTKKLVLKEYTEEIDRLKRDLMASRDKNGIYLAEESYTDMISRIESQNNELSDKESTIKAMKEEMSSKQKLFNEVNKELLIRSNELNESKRNLDATKYELGQTKNVLQHTNKRYQEKRHLLDNHVKTEAILTQQANSLRNVADLASSDTYRLHEAIERRSKSFDVIDSVTRQHINKTNNQINLFNVNFNEMLNHCNGLFIVQNNDFVDNKLKHMQSSESTLLNIKKLVSTEQMTIDALNGNVVDVAKKINQTLINHKSNREHLFNDLKVNKFEFQKNTKTAINSFGLSLAEQEEAFHDYHTKMKNLNSKSDENTLKFCNQQTINSDNDLVEKTDNIKKILKAIELLQTNINENNLRLKEIYENVDLVRKNNELCSETVTQLTENLKVIQVTSENKHQEQTEFINQYQAFVSNQTDELNKTLTNFTNDSEKHSAHVKPIISSMTKTIDEYVEKSVQQIDEEKNINHEQHIDVINNIENLVSDVITCNQTAGELLRINEETLVTGIQNEQERTDRAMIVCNSTNELINNALLVYGDGLRKQVENCHQLNENFHQNEIQIYQPTGDTPAKKQFQYPKTLVSTSPHEQIIRRFWINQPMHQHLDCSASVISEDNETTFFDGITDDKSSSILNIKSPPTNQPSEIEITNNINKSCNTKIINATTANEVSNDDHTLKPLPLNHSDSILITTTKNTSKLPLIIPTGESKQLIHSTSETLSVHRQDEKNSNQYSVQVTTIQNQICLNDENKEN